MSSPNDKYRSFLDPTEPPGTAEDFPTTVATDVDDDFMFTRGMQVLLGSILLLPGLGLTFLMALFARNMGIKRIDQPETLLAAAGVMSLVSSLGCLIRWGRPVTSRTIAGLVATVSALLMMNGIWAMWDKGQVGNLKIVLQAPILVWGAGYYAMTGKDSIAALLNFIAPAEKECPP